MNSVAASSPRTRDPEATRDAILQAASREIHLNGFRAASLDSILVEAGVTKGALYHHFGSKHALGLAVLREEVRATVVQRFLEPLAASANPIDTLVAVVEQFKDAATPEKLVAGCPLNNLAQEMSSVDEDFRMSLAAIFGEWTGGIAESLRRGQENGTVRLDIDPEAAGAYIVATFEGTIGLAKTTRDLALLAHCRQGMVAYFEALRP